MQIYANLWQIMRNCWRLLLKLQRRQEEEMEINKKLFTVAVVLV